MVAMFFSETSTWKFSPKIIPTFPLCSLSQKFCPTDTTEAADVLEAIEATDVTDGQDPQGMLELRMQQVIQELLEQQVQQMLHDLEPQVRQMLLERLELEGRQVIEGLLAQTNRPILNTAIEIPDFKFNFNNINGTQLLTM